MNNLPKELKVLVSKCVNLLGEVIKEEEGEKVYSEVENIRLEMVEYRKASKRGK
ncbi:MAG: hypothetical protein HN509_02010 [Halobacteriovoraceae bacterium]|nr:hypothetical protein [Halobacteriovoraceae bacterium]